MKCVNCKIRSKKYKKYMYCCILKREITFEICSGCQYKEYKKTVAMKKLSSKRSKALDISAKVKERVVSRDRGLCVVCGKPGIPNSHFVKRSQGGLGIEENIATHCLECHYYLDNGPDDERKKFIIQKTVENFKNNYSNWKRENLVYKKN